MTINIGADPFPPYQFETCNGITGMDYELIKESFASREIDIKVTLKVWSEIEKDYHTDKIRALFQVQPTETRMKQNLFSDELRKAVTEIITSQQGEMFQSLKPFYTDYYLGVLEGYSYGDDIDAIPEDRKHRYPTQESLLQATAAGKEPYAVFDRGVRHYLQTSLEIDNIVPLPGMDFLRPLAVMFKQHDNQLRDTFNTGLRTIKESGTYDKIIKEWQP
jgi:ABC-type amino acid transport substrate-binding protein